MRKITLVSSAHRENGRCNAEELLRILRAIGPEVVFEEVRPSDSDTYHKAQWSLEAKALSRYRESRTLRPVPVDHFNDNDATASLYDQMNQVFGYVEQASQTYRALLEEQGRLVNQQGFQYLNSIAYEETAAKLEDIENAAIADSCNLGLIRSLQWWRDWNRRREAEMIRAIYQYCQDNSFGTGVYLVGAAHKSSLVKAIRARDGTDAALIDWDFTFAGPN